MDTPVTTPHDQRHRTRLWLQLGVAFAAFIMIGMQDGAVGVLLPNIQAHYGLNKSTVSTLFFAGTCGYLMAAFSSGILVEKLGQRLFLMLGSVLFFCGSATVALQPAWFVVLLALVSLGFGIAIIDAGLNTIVAAMPNNTTLLNYLHAFYGVGALIGPLLASNILKFGWGWNVEYAVIATLTVLLTISIGVAFRTTMQHPNATTHESAQGGNVMAQALRLSPVWIAAFFLLLYVGAEVSIGNWSFSFLSEERNIDLMLGSSLVSGYWAGLTLGRLVLGSVARRLGDVAMINLCLAGLVAGVLLLWLPLGPIVAGIALALAGFCLGPIFPTMIAVISQRVPARLLPSSIGFMTSFGAGGAAFFPWLAGTLANALGVWVVMPYVIGLTAILLVLWFAFNTRAGHAADHASAA